ncbi:MAG: PorT family protein [Bacteroidetes bacterium]|nr:PorT family protein [Bacteroidota bacterium]
MRAQTLIIALVLCIVSSSEINAEGFFLKGVKFGFNSSKFTGTDIPGKGIASIPGLTLGYFINYEVSNRFSLQSELLFTTKGCRINTVGDIYLHNIFTYIEIPILAKWTFITEKKWRPYLHGGPFLDFKLLVFNEEGFPEDFRKIDLGLILGAGIRFNKISFGVNYNRGFLNFDQSEKNIDLKNQTISVVVGFSF